MYTTGGRILGTGTGELELGDMNDGQTTRIRALPFHKSLCALPGRTCGQLGFPLFERESLHCPRILFVNFIMVTRRRGKCDILKENG